MRIVFALVVAFIIGLNVVALVVAFSDVPDACVRVHRPSECPPAGIAERILRKLT